MNSLHQLLARSKSATGGLLAIAEPHLGMLAIAVGLLLVAAVTGFILWQRRLLNDYEQELVYLQELLHRLRRSNGLDDNLQQLLAAVGRIVPAPYITCYVLGETTNQFDLRAVRHPFDAFDQVAPSYSGLALPNRDAYVPPPTIDPFDGPEQVVSSEAGGYHLLTFVTQDRVALVRVVTVEPLTPKARDRVVRVLREVEAVLDDLVYAERQTLRAQMSQFADAAVRQVAAVTTDPEGAVELVMESFARGAGGYGALYLDDASDGPAVRASHALRDTADRIRGDGRAVDALRFAASAAGPRLFARQDPEFYQLPAVLTALEIGAAAVAAIPQRGTLVLLYDKSFDPAAFTRTGAVHIRLLVERLAELLSRDGTDAAATRSNAQLLMDLVDVLDNLNPYTVGYSESVLRYALAIGQEMGMTGQALLDLGLAARLSNVGVLGLQQELATKEGRYTEFEYQAMQMHAEIGAEMVRIATGNQRAASFVLHHHERIDGRGYPHHLRGDEIPLGARILHAVQFFLAKVGGRSWRDPLALDAALQAMWEVAGTQLDEGVVQALERWLNRLAVQPDLQDRPLAPCHVMLSVPSMICEACAVYHRPQVVKCWEVPDNACHLHGRSCDTCIVKTEYLSRQKRLRMQGGGA
ncbi:MAG: hypothetical protein K6T78_02180 [Alicyclobacillus sp.]|nr:hypothetical protein [Alicyclobacillus sp.]